MRVWIKLEGGMLGCSGLLGSCLSCVCEVQLTGLVSSAITTRWLGTCSSPFTSNSKQCFFSLEPSSCPNTSEQ